MTIVSIALLASLSLNLITQFGLGIQSLPEDADKASSPLPLFQACILAIAVPPLWAFFSGVILPYISVLFAYFLMFPLSMLVCWALEIAAERFVPRVVPKHKLFDALSAYNGLAFTALALTVHIAADFLEAFVMSISFAAGTLLSILILNEIQKRASIENVPAFLRGKPLRLISTGFLSIIFTSTAVILLKALAG